MCPAYQAWGQDGSMLTEFLFFTILISSHIYWTSFVNNVLINFKLQHLPPFNRREYHHCPGEGEKFELKLNVESFKKITSILSLIKYVFKGNISLQLWNS